VTKLLSDSATKDVKDTRPR